MYEARRARRARCEVCDRVPCQAGRQECRGGIRAGQQGRADRPEARTPPHVPRRNSRTATATATPTAAACTLILQVLQRALQPGTPSPLSACHDSRRRQPFTAACASPSSGDPPERVRASALTRFTTHRPHSAASSLEETGCTLPSAHHHTLHLTTHSHSHSHSPSQPAGTASRHPRLTTNLLPNTPEPKNDLSPTLFPSSQPLHLATPTVDVSPPRAAIPPTRPGTPALVSRPT